MADKNNKINDKDLEAVNGGFFADIDKVKHSVKDVHNTDTKGGNGQILDHKYASCPND